MNPEGQIEIDLVVYPNGDKQIEIINNRPVKAAQLLVGKSVNEALMIIPLLFHVCGKAQGMAAISAIEGALQVRIDERTRSSRMVLTDMELIREHLLRIFLDWPETILDCEMGNKAHTSKGGHENCLPQIMKLLPLFEDALFGDSKAFSLEGRAQPDHCKLDVAFGQLEDFLCQNVFGCAPDLWASADSRSVVLHWMANGKTIAAKSCQKILAAGWAAEGICKTAYLPEISAQEWRKTLFANNDLAFFAAPQWQGAPCETSALSRNHQHPLLQTVITHCGTGLLARHISRLVELALVFMRLKHTIRSLVDDKNKNLSELTSIEHNEPEIKVSSPGIGVVEAARGLLVHGVKIDRSNSADQNPGLSKIEDYRILAPTEWNFHPSGSLAMALKGIRGKDLSHVRQMAEMLIPSIDPCVATKLEVRHA